MKNLYSITFFLITIFLGAQISSYKLDSLEKKSYEELENIFYKAQDEDTILAQKCAEIYLAKGKKNKNSIDIARGYRFLGYTNNKQKALQYADSIIWITKNSSHRSYPTRGYIVKGGLNYELGNYKEALDNYLIALSYAEKKNNIRHVFFAKNAIGVLKNRWGAYEEVLKIHKDLFKLIKEQPNYEEEYSKEYLASLHNTANSYLKNELYDSVLLISKIGMRESIEKKDSLKYFGFLFFKGMAFFYKNKYDSALLNLKKSNSFLSPSSKMINDYYIGMTYYKKEEKEKAIKYMLKVDTIFNITRDEFPELIDVYKILSDYYKKENNTQKQLLYIRKLVEVDSILNSNYIYINTLIKNKYDIPELIKEKESIINKIKKKERESQYYISGLIGVVVLLFLGLGWNYQKQKLYRQKFETLVNKTQEEKKEEKIRSIESDKKELAVPDEIASVIMEQLNSFEQNKGFLQRDITLQNLANNFNTNSSYLSKVINYFKGKNFAAYLNKLRIDESVRRLKEDAQFRKFTIQAIAHESGFKSSQSFSRAFFKETGIYPSYFLKEFEK